MTPLHEAVLAVLDGGGGMFFRMIADRAAGLLPEAGAAWLQGHRGSGGDLGPGVGGAADKRHPGAAAHGPRHRAAGGGRRPDCGAPGGPGGPAMPGAPGALAANGLGAGPMDWAGPAGQAGRVAGLGQAGRPERSRLAAAAQPAGPHRPVRGRAGRARGRMGDGQPHRASHGDRPLVAAATARPGPDQAAHALARTLLERHGILTKGAVTAERAAGGFGALYPVLRAMEEAGHCRRGYFVEGLGAPSSRCLARWTGCGPWQRMRPPRPRSSHLSSPEPARMARGARRALAWRGEGATRPDRDRAGGGRPRQSVRRGAALARPAR